MSSFFTQWNLRRNFMVEKQKQQISELQFDKFPSKIIFGLENTIQKSSDYLFRFSIGRNFVDKEVEIVDSLDELKSSRSVSGKHLSKI